MPVPNSPLRYPGGKAVLADFLASVIEANGLSDAVYVEPYAGGAGAALNLLFAEHVRSIILNDADRCVYAFWRAVLNQKDDFIRLIKRAPVTIKEWRHQKAIYEAPSRHSQLRVGFATFFLNRCNRSGILMKGGPIGGFDQSGEWKVNARYNKEELVRRIEMISLYRDRISVFKRDAIDFLKNLILTRDDISRLFVYLDPPYYEKGSLLYLNHYQHEDHAALAKFIKRQTAFKWVMSYDNVPEIHALYCDKERVPFSLSYSAHICKEGCELLIHSNRLSLPEDLGLLKKAFRAGR